MRTASRQTNVTQSSSPFKNVDEIYAEIERVLSIAKSFREINKTMFGGLVMPIPDCIGALLNAADKAEEKAQEALRELAAELY